jgi:outer membrane lipopolysaccharide assembly protein LptE/RlpB
MKTTITLALLMTAVVLLAGFYFRFQGNRQHKQQMQKQV